MRLGPKSLGRIPALEIFGFLLRSAAGFSCGLGVVVRTSFEREEETECLELAVAGRCGDWKVGVPGLVSADMVDGRVWVGSPLRDLFEDLLRLGLEPL